MSNHELQAWVDETAEQTQPDSVHWCDGSQAEIDRLNEMMVASGDDLLPNYGMGPDEFFVLGDNSPMSKDGRLWTGPRNHFVHRDLLTGKALFVYWPHAWNRPLPLTPNFRRMHAVR